jgi:hypothetical protein
MMSGYFFLVFACLALLTSLLWIWAVIDILRSDFKKDSDKIVWLLVVFFLHFFGAIIYLVIGTKQKVENA